ncbi:hypothetical protein [Epilithonimonas xixisoli]|uniref:Uncharacterized protein n=1 Tax=Epilithonimonas xixisoli TaxID=1476462 RepID=A0A4R8I5U6_9FLAO|nr:hypothetical protein [Epilithonimonas xixisoli]TDX83939.1 hypothetical protein B0I22_1527 [Epilithonimonas xixisoli]
MAENKLFGDFNPEELEKFEKDTNGVVIFNGFGDNAISFQNTEDNVIFYVDKIDEASDDKEHTAYPNLFLLDKGQIGKLYNFLAEFINANPETYKIRLE